MSSLAMAVANIQRSGSPTSLSTPNTRCNNSAYGQRSFTSSRQGSSVHYNRSTAGSRRGNSSNICKFFLQGRCNKGSSCPFRHQPSSNNSLSGSSRAPSRARSLAVCKFFLNGNCTRGSSCAFRHELNDDDTISVVTMGSGMPPPPTTTLSSTPSRRVCKFYANGNCIRGTSCKFLHENSSSTTNSNSIHIPAVAVPPRSAAPSVPKGKPSIEAIRARAAIAKAKQAALPSLSSFLPNQITDEVNSTLQVESEGEVKLSSGVTSSLRATSQSFEATPIKTNVSKPLYSSLHPASSENALGSISILPTHEAETDTLHYSQSTTSKSAYQHCSNVGETIQPKSTVVVPKIMEPGESDHVPSEMISPIESIEASKISTSNKSMVDKTTTSPHEHIESIQHLPLQAADEVGTSSLNSDASDIGGIDTTESEMMQQLHNERLPSKTNRQVNEITPSKGVSSLQSAVKSSLQIAAKSTYNNSVHSSVVTHEVKELPIAKTPPSFAAWQPSSSSAVGTSQSSLKTRVSTLQTAAKSSLHPASQGKINEGTTFKESSLETLSSVDTNRSSLGSKVLPLPSAGKSSLQIANKSSLQAAAKSTNAVNAHVKESCLTNTPPPITPTPQSSLSAIVTKSSSVNNTMSQHSSVAPAVSNPKQKPVEGVYSSFRIDAHTTAAVSPSPIVAKEKAIQLDTGAIKTSSLANASKKSAGDKPNRSSLAIASSSLASAASIEPTSKFWSSSAKTIVDPPRDEQDQSNTNLFTSKKSAPSALTSNADAKHSKIPADAEKMAELCSCLLPEAKDQTTIPHTSKSSLMVASTVNEASENAFRETTIASSSNQSNSTTSLQTSSQVHDSRSSSTIPLKEPDNAKSSSLAAASGIKTKSNSTNYSLPTASKIPEPKQSHSSLLAASSTRQTSLVATKKAVVKSSWPPKNHSTPQSSLSAKASNSRVSSLIAAAEKRNPRPSHQLTSPSLNRCNVSTPKKGHVASYAASLNKKKGTQSQQNPSIIKDNHDHMPKQNDTSALAILSNNPLEPKAMKRWGDESDSDSD